MAVEWSPKGNCKTISAEFQLRILVIPARFGGGFHIVLFT